MSNDSTKSEEFTVADEVNEKALLRRWAALTWDEMAKENPMYAVMSSSDFLTEGAGDFDLEKLQQFFKKGRRLFETHVQPCLNLLKPSAERPVLVEYGCGMGRILRAVVDGGYSCAGVDISPTMLDHCRETVKGGASLLLVNEEGHSGLPDAFADVVYSYAVLQHIQKLSVFRRAIHEICRLTKPEGVIAIQLNCEDFQSGDLQVRGRTENFEEYSLHYHPGESEPYRIKRNTNWQGVYIGYELLISDLAEHGICVEKTYVHNPKKPRGVWVIGRKV